MYRRSLVVVAVVATVALGGLAGCGGNGDKDGESAKPGGQAARPVSITAEDFAFRMPSSITGGVVSLAFANRGAEPHLAGILKLAAGKSFDDVKAFFSAPPSGPPPFALIGGLPTAGPGGTGNQVLELDAGSYALFCPLAGADGIPHFAKGMLSPFTVTPGGTGRIPKGDVEITAKDFSFTALPTFSVGDITLELENRGNQLHEVNLVAFEPGKGIDDLKAFFTKPQGPPPARFLSGAAIRPGARTTTRITLERGVTYAFICAIPDDTDNGIPHLLKGMFTPTFTAT